MNSENTDINNLEIVRDRTVEQRNEDRIDCENKNRDRDTALAVEKRTQHSAITSLTEKAVSKHKQGETQAAISLYSAIIELENQQPAWIYGNLITLLAQRRIGEGIELSQKALEIYPESDEIYRAAAILYSNNHQSDKVVEYNLKAIKLNNQQPDWVYCNTARYLCINNPELNLKLCEQGINNYPDCYWLYYYLIDSYYSLGNREQARKIYQLVYQLEPDLEKIDPELHKALIQLSSENEHSDANNTIDNSPTNKDYFLPANKARHQTLISQDSIKKDVENIINVETHNENRDRDTALAVEKRTQHSAITSLTEKAVSKHKQGETQAAISLYSAIIELENQQPAWIYGNLITLLAQRRIGEGIELSQKALEIYPESDEIYRAAAILYSNNHQSDKVVEYNLKAIKLNNQQPDWVYCNTARYLCINNPELNLKLCEQGINNYPDCYWLYYYLIDSYYSLGNREQARKIYQLVYQLEPDLEKIDPELHKALIQLSSENEHSDANNTIDNSNDRDNSWLLKERAEQVGTSINKVNKLELENKKLLRINLLLNGQCTRLINRNKLYKLLLCERKISNETRQKYELIVESDLFDIDFYLQTYPDVKKAQINPLLHYLEQGYKEGKNPNAFFDTKFYVEHYLEKLDGICPLIHFLKYGTVNKLRPSKKFDTAFYLENNQDVINNKINPLIHYIRYGQYENRIIKKYLKIKPKNLKFGQINTPVQCLTSAERLKSANNRQRVLIYSHNLKLQGAPISLSTIVMGYLNKNIEPIVFSSSLGLLKEEYEKLGIKVIKCNFNNERFIDRETYLQQLSELKQVIDSYNIDAAHINTLLGHHIVHACSQLNIPTLLNIRESVDPFASFKHWSEYQQTMSIEAFKRAKDVVFVANKTKALWSSIYREKPAQVIYNSIIEESYIYRIHSLSKSECRVLLGIKENEIVILSVGTISERKGQKDLISCLSELIKSTNSDFKVVLIGGNETNYCRQIKEAIALFPQSIQEKVIIVPETNSDREKTLVSQYYLASDIFVLNSRNESYPRVILEAMLFSLAIVSTPNFGVVEQVKENENALFYQEGNHLELAHKISLLLNSNNLRRQFAYRSRNIFEQINSYEGMIEQYSNIIHGFNFDYQ